MTKPRNEPKKSRFKRKHVNIAEQRFVPPKDIEPISDKPTMSEIVKEQQQIRIFLQRTMGYQGVL